MRFLEKYLSKKDVRGIINSYVVYHGLIGFALWWSLWVKVLLDRGMTLYDVGILTAIYRVGGVLFEIPTGVIADRYGRRLSLVLGALLYALALVMFVYSQNSMVMLSVSMLAWAMADAFESGTASAYIWQSLQGDSRTEEGAAAAEELERNFRRAESRSTTALLLAAGVGCLISFHLYEISPSLPFLVDSGLVLFAAYVSWRYFLPGKVRPAGDNHQVEGGHGVRDEAKRVSRTFREVFDWRVLRVLLSRLPLALAILSMPILYQAVIEETPSLDGKDSLFYLFYLAVGVLGSTLSERVSGKVGSRAFYRYMTGAMAVLLVFLFGLTSGVLALFFALALQFVYQIQSPASEAYVNSLLTEDTRASALSVTKFFEELVASGLAIVVGYAGTSWGTGEAGLTLAGILLLVLAISYVIDTQRKKKLRTE